MGTLLGLGVFVRDFSIQGLQIFLTFITGVSTHFLITQYLKINIPYFSTLITCLGLSLLLRADSIWVHPLIVFLAISSKFFIRINQKHIFNPAMFGVILAINLLPGTWVSPGQWGYEISIGLWLIVFGFIVAGRAKISEISFAFLGFYFSFLLYRILKFEYSFEVFLHQIQNGAFILFTFFMITDPKTIPNHKMGRIVHAGCVAFIAYNWSFSFFKTNSFIWALFLCSPLVIFWDFLFRAEHYKWAETALKKKAEGTI
jgi:Na+-transporting NADH:ubiquinone oxidoreductase subunit NqrB